MALLVKKNVNWNETVRIESLISAGIDYEKLSDLIIKNRVYPAISTNLKYLEETAFFSEHKSKIDKLNRRNLFRCLEQQKALLEITKVFEDRGIRYLILKGVTLSTKIYGEPSARMSKDIDILVDKADFLNAESVLLELGYISQDLPEGLSKKQKKHYLNIANHLSYQKSVQIELHWKMVRRIDVPFDKLYGRRVEVLTNGYKLTTLSNEDDFIYLLIHGIKHGFFRLKWLVDLMEIVEKGDLDWSLVLAEVDKQKLNKSLVVLSILLEDFWQIKLPVDIEMGDNAKALANYAKTMMVLNEEEMYTITKKYDLLIRNSIKAKIDFVLFHFRPQIIDFKGVKLDDKYFFLYYILRPLLKVKRIIAKVRK